MIINSGIFTSTNELNAAIETTDADVTIGDYNTPSFNTKYALSVSGKSLNIINNAFTADQLT